jgi:hypothetical protein
MYTNKEVGHVIWPDEEDGPLMDDTDQKAAGEVMEAIDEIREEEGKKELPLEESPSDNPHLQKHRENISRLLESDN